VAASETEARKVQVSDAAQVAFPEAVRSLIEAMDERETVLFTGVGPGGDSGVSDDATPILVAVTDTGIHYVDAIMGGASAFLSKDGVAGHDGSPYGDGTALAECYDASGTIIFRMWLGRADGLEQLMAFAAAMPLMDQRLKNTRFDP
jgi:hypothetical protein